MQNQLFSHRNRIQLTRQQERFIRQNRQDLRSLIPFFLVNFDTLLKYNQCLPIQHNTAIINCPLYYYILFFIIQDKIVATDITHIIVYVY